jgi:CHAT domain-containing protein
MEARAVAELRGGTAIVGDEATVDVVVREIDGASVAHLACHGVFRGDNPLMSSLSMADGPITVYDLEQLQDPPVTLVLSACEVAQSQRLAGDALLGMTASLMAAGTRSIIAATTVVSDQAAPQFMERWHRSHSEGASPAQALAHARSSTSGDPRARAVAASFLCLGA